MLKIGLTGGIGSGKSIVGRAFEMMGIPIYVADNEAKRLMVSDAELQNLLVSRFGDQIYDSNFNLNRELLAEIVFNDSEALKDINSIVHPAVRKDFIRWCEQHSQTPYVIQESAIIFDSGLYKNFDKIITVAAEDEIRIQRVMERDSISRELIVERMRSQLPESVRIEKADFVIYNNTELILPQIERIDKQIRSLVNK
ncbi:dephospho-CoA kinase [Labilibaculum euxinus]|uniref:Dephospho-CoA kinase n=1 Tax=Labilibaculum euxinus TaxID=2686357 RepID=A0A7M4D5Z9_9BACT|nr:dephospho-CoA kinase [Labilibaculum euxinus]MUP38078.1 dephospho-CoA kinase [Labilibaculum euxinus]MVB07283.1 dephospho-CoA kinase [Labilibaculum euxinus]